MALPERGGGAGVGAVQLKRQCVELLEREVVVGLLQGPAQPGLDGLAVALGEMVKHVALLVLRTALDGDVVAEHPADGFPQALRSVDHEQNALLDVEAAVDQTASSAPGDGRVLTRPVPQPERELITLGVIPNATMFVRPCRSIPSSMILGDLLLEQPP